MSMRLAKKPQKGDKSQKSHKVIARPNSLKAKAGAGGLRPGAIEQAQKAALSLKGECLKDVKRHLLEIELVLEQEAYGDHEVLRVKLSTLAAEVFAFCGTCGLETIGKIAKSLDRLALKPGLFDKQDFDLVGPHLQALGFAVKEFSQPDASEEACKSLLIGLEAAVENRCALA